MEIDKIQDKMIDSFVNNDSSDNILQKYTECELPKILFYDIKTGEVLFDYTLDDYLKDNQEEDESSNESPSSNEYVSSNEDVSSNESASLNEDESFYQDKNINIIGSNVKDINKSYFFEFKSSSRVVNVLRRPINNLKNTYIEKIVPFNDKEIYIFTKMYFSKNKFINNPSTVYYIYGDVYKGEINKKLQRSGNGILYFANGDKLVVNWVKNNAEGFGRYIYFDGNRLEGYWINNIFQNNKMLTIYPNNESFNGSFLNDKKEGYGIYTWPNGSSYKGMWSNDLYNGYGILDYRDNNGNSFIYKGNWFNGCYILNSENTY
jgi:hypothetical protein